MGIIKEIQQDHFHIKKLMFLLIMLVVICGCKDSTKVSKPTEVSHPVTNNDIAINEENKKTDINTERNEPVFFGVWEFTKTLPGYISGLTQEEADSYIGKKIQYLQSFYEFENESINNPYYKYEKMLASDFIEGYKLSNEDWDIQEKYITKVEVYPDEPQKDSLEEYVDSFFIIDSHLIINIEGEFFEMDRVANSGNKRMIVNPSIVEKGQTIGELTISELDISETGTDLQVNDITFSGELTVSGTYEWADTGDGVGCIITLDEEKVRGIPLLEGFENENTIVIRNTNEAKELLPDSNGSGTFIITNYSIGHRQIMISAELVEVIE